MPLPLTGLIVICGLMGPGADQVSCQADVYHNIADSSGTREQCPNVVMLMSAKLEGLREGQGLRQVRGKAECLPGELDELLPVKLPGYMRDTWGAKSVNVVHHDVNTGQITEKGQWIDM